jgi:predicted nucleic acid-binding protein
MLAYIDSSVVLRKVFGQPNPTGMNQMTYGVSSELLQVECLRSADRFRVSNDGSEEDFLKRIDLIYDSVRRLELIRISPEVLSRASQSFPTTLGTLDAIHLATCLIYRERSGQEITLCSHDLGLKKAAKAMGLQTLG